MNNFLVSAQRFLKNKNTVTILGVVIILVLLYLGYRSQINSAVNPVQVPIATETIQPRTEITEDMVETVDMPSISVSDNVITAKASVVGKYSNINTVIPEGSMFYTDTVVDKDEIPDSVYVKVKEGEKILTFDVNVESTYGNTIMPGNVIDLYMKAGDGTEEKLMIGKLVENVEVLAVKDSSGRDVFENTSESRTPSFMLVGVPEDVYLLLTKALYLDSLGVELFPVPQGGVADTDGATEVSTQELADYIEAHAVDLQSDSDEDVDELLPTITLSNKKATMKFVKGCKSKYSCAYTMSYTSGTNASGVVTSRKKTITLKGAGTLTVTLTESDGTIHTTTQEIDADGNAVSSATGTETDTVEDTITDATEEQ